MPSIFTGMRRTLFRFLLAVGAAGNGGAFFFSLFSFKNYVL